MQVSYIADKTCRIMSDQIFLIDSDVPSKILQKWNLSDIIRKTLSDIIKLRWLEFFNFVLENRMLNVGKQN